MSTGDMFQEKWVRTSSARRMLMILTYLAKRDTIRIPLNDLENVEVGEGVIETYNEGNLVLIFAPVNTKIAFLGDERAIERTPTQWSPMMEEEAKRQAAEATGLPISTLDDALMAEREQRVGQGVARAAALQRRREPLPVPTPSHPPQS